MKLFHVTPRSNQQAIYSQGLLVEKSQGRERVLWLVSRSRVEWAIRHVKQRHGVDDVAVLYVRVKARAVRKRPNLCFTTDRDIPPVDVLGELFVSV